MILQEIIDEIHWITNTNSSTFPDNFVKAGINMHYGEIIHKILLTTGDWNLQGKKWSTNLISTTGLTDECAVGYDGGYSFPADMIRPIRVEISYDGTKYRKVALYDINQNDDSEHNEQSNFSDSNPYVRFFDNRFVIRPLPTTTVNGGIRIWGEKRQGDLVDATDTPVFEPNFHSLLVFLGAVRFGLKHPEKMDKNWKSRAYGLEQDMIRWYANKYFVPKSIRPVIENYK